MRYEILDKDGKVESVIVAEEAFVSSKYPGRFRAIEQEAQVEAEAPKDMLAEIEKRLLAIEAKIDSIKTDTSKAG